MAKTKVAVLGGGVGGCVAAMQLTSTAELRQQFEVTIYQLGFRLGGKGASGRNATAGQRIEEHGLHMWFGFYDNAFRVMREAYTELGRIPGTDPLATLEEAFAPLEGIAFYDRQDGEWVSSSMGAPGNGGVPGDGQGLPTFWDINVAALEFFKRRWDAFTAATPSLSLAGYKLPKWLQAIGATLGVTVDSVLDAALLYALSQATPVKALVPPATVAQARESYVSLLGLAREAIWAAVKPFVEDDAELRLFFTSFDVVVTTMQGLVADAVMDDPRGFQCLDDWDLAAWLKHHGAKDVTIGKDPGHRSPLLRALYDLSFGYPKGDIALADISAGTAIDDFLRLAFAYRGHLAYKMEAGMGDAVFVPFYEVLKERGVTFRFFTEVTQVNYDAATGLIESIDYDEQATTISGKPYEPLIDVGGLPCWPTAPDLKQLAPTQALAGFDFEDTGPHEAKQAAARAQQVKPRKLVRTSALAPGDFDEVVLAISIPALAPLTKSLQAIPRFQEALAHAHWTPTQAFQVWLTPTTQQLGYPHGRATVAGTFVEPLDTYADMSHLVGRELWPAGAVGSIAYFCGVLPPGPDSVYGVDANGNPIYGPETQADGNARVRKLSIDFLEQDAAGLWPLAAVKSTLGGFDWSLLSGATKNADASEFDKHYWRSNIRGTELYVLSVAGSIKHRLPSADPGPKNMVAAGDWTSNTLCGGCVEAAAISGIEAANELARRAFGAGDPRVPPPPTNALRNWLA